MEVEPPSTSSQHSKRKPKRKRNQQDPELEKLNSLPWNTSVHDDPFSVIIGSNELEGGFLSLEEIDEADYGLEIPEPEEDKRKKSKQKTKLKKQKRDRVDDSPNDVVEASIEDDMVNDDSGKSNLKKKKKKKKKKTKKKKRKKAMKENQKVEQSAADQITNVKDDIEEDNIDETEFYAWNELRLHPLLMKAICKLGFKEPTPIQKACIPAASHQGKDVIGAAETGSGKTLAFGLPILQRLLEEREKAAKMLEKNSEELEKYAPKGLLRALIIAPTRELALQVTDHLKAVAKFINVRVIPIVGGILAEKQERLLKARPEIIVGTPGRLWELMSAGEKHLVELHSLSFFVLDEADRMVENGHFKELQSIIDMLPMSNLSVEDNGQYAQNCVTVSSYQRKKRQTLVFSATVALSSDFRKKLKCTSTKQKQLVTDGLNSIETLSERAGMRASAAIIDLTNPSILAAKIEESFIECREEDKDAYLYYILTVHGQGCTIVFCTSIAALRYISSLLRILRVNVWTLHAQMQQRARLKAIDHFRENENGILVATDVAARGLDIPGVRTVVHYQLPHSVDVYVHRSGRTARASAEGCSIALISPKDTSKFASLCKSFSKDTFQQFPLENSYMPEVLKRLSIARQIDKIVRKDSQEKAKKSWLERNAESVEIVMENYDSEEERVNKCKQMKATSTQLKKLQQELNVMLSHPLQSKALSHRYLAGAGITLLMQEQFQQLAKQKLGDHQSSGINKKGKLVVIGQDCVEALQALRCAGEEVRTDVKDMTGKQRNIQNLRRKRKEEKKRLRDQRRKQKRKLRQKDE